MAASINSSGDATKPFSSKENISESLQTISSFKKKQTEDASPVPGAQKLCHLQDSASEAGGDTWNLFGDRNEKHSEAGFVGQLDLPLGSKKSEKIMPEQSEEAGLSKNNSGKPSENIQIGVLRELSSSLMVESDTPSVSTESQITHVTDLGIEQVEDGEKSICCGRICQFSNYQQEEIQVTLLPTVIVPSIVHIGTSDKMWTSDVRKPVKIRMEMSGPGSESPVTIYQMFKHSVDKYQNQIALAYKYDERWHKISYQEYYQECRRAAKSFLHLGLKRYYGVGILGFNSPEWFFSSIGAILAGGVAVGIYTTNTPEACQYVAYDCRANVLVVENHKQLEKILKIKDTLPNLKAIVQYKGHLKDAFPDVYTWRRFMELSSNVSDKMLDDVIQDQNTNECCLLVYTSGTTGNPKGVMLSHDNITWTSYMVGQMAEIKILQERIVSYLPLSHIAAQVLDIWLPMRFGGTTFFADADALKGSLVITLREIRPTSFLGVPRVWEKLQEKLKEGGLKSSTLKQKVAAWAKRLGLRMSENIMAGNDVVPWGYSLANSLVFKKVRNILGLNHCLKCFTAAAPITRDTLEFFLSLRIPLFELYGMSETSGPHTISLAGLFRTMSCGKVLSGCKIMIGNQDQNGNGEIHLNGRNIFMGYLNMPKQTETEMDDDGWLHSGDLGVIDQDGFVYITGRLKELIITAGGENIPPIPIENAVKRQIPIISNAMLIGDKRKFLSILLTLKTQTDLETGKPLDRLNHEAIVFCKLHGSNATTVSEIVLKKDPAIYTAIQLGIDEVNKMSSSNAQKIQKFFLTLMDFSIFGGELGPTMKMKRPVVHQMYKNEIDSLYK